ncbi:hypothetical protein CS022_10860 [Veronia nyctiphanis]|uniref:Uncharacterized protein n=1 Tax=Veronia nyctiphanis TaxID=1278244 RepID=A0A4Q0YRH0_9GAMM|nr:extracellular solute-binding protein [Veronia nyctiphanis]RXJ73235.1 hypothetical protein CS022_10860 [Veronia nyctiphanis]
MMMSYPALSDALTISSRGGAYSDAYQSTLYRPFSELKNIYIADSPHNNRLYRNADLFFAPDWDVIELTETVAIEACQSGLLTPLSAKMKAEFESSDFAPHLIHTCSIAHQYDAVVIAYDRAVFATQLPTNISDFFDLDDYPGKRGLQKKADIALEWALLANGVPIQQIYHC